MRLKKKHLIVIGGVCISVFLAGCFSNITNTTNVNDTKPVEETGDVTQEERVEENVVEDVDYSETFAQANVGDRIEFGRYEQDGDESNGSEPISWIVIDKTGAGELTLIAAQILDRISLIDDAHQSCQWDESIAREWLNNDFYNTAFSDNDKKYIVPSVLESKTFVTATTSYSISEDDWGATTTYHCDVEKPDSTITTEDYVYVLSREEADKLLISVSNTLSSVKPTAYAAQKIFDTQEYTNESLFNIEHNEVGAYILRDDCFEIDGDFADFDHNDDFEKYITDNLDVFMSNDKYETWDSHYYVSFDDLTKKAEVSEYSGKGYPLIRPVIKVK
jgi:hypothetical protein